MTLDVYRGRKTTIQKNTYNVYTLCHDSTRIHTKWLAEARGGNYLLKTPIFIRFNYKIWLFPPQFEVFML